MRVREILQKKGLAVVSIDPERSIYDAVQLLVEKNIGSLLVIDHRERVVGIITERDILKECARRFAQLRETRVREVMTRDLVVGGLDDTLNFVRRVMTEQHIRHLPILTDDKLEGLISIGDVVKQLHEATREEADDLREKLARHYVVE